MLILVVYSANDVGITGPYQTKELDISQTQYFIKQYNISQRVTFDRLGHVVGLGLGDSEEDKLLLAYSAFILHILDLDGQPKP